MPAGVHVRSKKFPILPGEAQELVNEGTYGKAFAEYLATHLRARGWEVPGACCEDWGWWVEIEGQPYQLGLCCYGASDAGDKPELYVMLSMDGGRKWSWSAFRRLDTTERVAQLAAAMKAILDEDPEIEILGYPDEFPL